MFTLFGKKKMEVNRVANIFINALIDTVEKGFPEVAALINESPEFVISPEINEEHSDLFLMIVIAGNLVEVPTHLDAKTDTKFIQEVNSQLAYTFGMEPGDLQHVIQEYQSFMSRVNFPSKNTQYAMSKAVFHKYKLNDFQDNYFKNMNSPNPLFLKRLDEVMEHFLWNWSSMKEKYQIV